MSKILAIKLRRLAAELIKTADALQQKLSVEKIGQATYQRSNGLLVIGRKKRQLTKGEATILTALLDHRGTMLSRDELTALMFGMEAVNITSRTVDTHICTLRRYGLETIETVHGRGYMLP